MLSRTGLKVVPKIARKPHLTVVVEGNIGSGKTTFLSHFHQNYMIDIVEEPVSRWQNVGGHNLLELMYQDPKRWGFSFQTHVQLTMLQNHSQPSRRPVKMMERSLHSARHCFVENLYQTGIMCEEQKSVLDAWYKWMQEKGSLDVDLFIYLRTKPEVVRDRVIARGRAEEQDSVNMDLLSRLHNLHDKWLMSPSFPVPTLVLDGNLPLAEMKGEYQRCDDAINRLLQNSDLLFKS